MAESKEKETEKKTSHRHSSSSIWAAILIIVGLILLLNNLGLVSWQIWASVWRAWPIILVLAGIEIVLGKSFISRVLVFAISLAVIGLLFIFALAPSNPQANLWLKKNLPGLYKNFSLPQSSQHFPPQFQPDFNDPFLEKSFEFQVR